MTCFLGFLSATLGLAQWRIQVVPLQWIFSAVSTGFLYVVTVALIFQAWNLQRLQQKKLVDEEHEKQMETNEQNSCNP